jgi:hypothetical protein
MSARLDIARAALADCGLNPDRVWEVDLGDGPKLRARQGDLPAIRAAALGAVAVSGPDTPARCRRCARTAPGVPVTTPHCTTAGVLLEHPDYICPGGDT